MDTNGYWSSNGRDCSGPPDSGREIEAQIVRIETAPGTFLHVEFGQEVANVTSKQLLGSAICASSERGVPRLTLRHPNDMDTAFLDQLAHQLRINKTPPCRHAINRILEEMKKRCDDGEYDTPMAAESAFREFVGKERAWQEGLKNSDQRGETSTIQRINEAREFAYTRLKK